MSAPWDELGLEVAVQVPLWGRNWPAQPTWIVGVNGTLQLWDPDSDAEESADESRGESS